MNPLRLHILQSPNPDALERLRSRLDPGVQVTVGPREGRPADILVSGRPVPEDLDPPPGMLLIPYAGLPSGTRELLLERPQIRVHNIHHNAVSAAEMAVSLLLAAGKSLIPADQAMRRGDWSPRFRPGLSWVAEGRQAVIVGYGAIGTKVALACRALGMKTAAVRRDPGKGARTGSGFVSGSGSAMSARVVDRTGAVVEGCAGTEAHTVDEIHPATHLPDLLPRAEALILCLPLTPETRGLIGARELEAMPREAVLVNVGRGELVAEKALYEALRDGTIRAAGLDVWYRYPGREPGYRPGQGSDDDFIPVFPSEYLFHELENVVMSPHRGGALGLAETEERRMDAIALAANAAARGEPVPHSVDPALGY